MKWIAIAVGGVAVILLVVSAVWVWVVAERLDERVAAYRSAGDPVSLGELARPPIPPETNAAVILDRARDELDAVEEELSEVLQSDVYRRGTSKEAELKTVRSALEAHPDVLPLLRQAAACTDYDSEPDYEAGPRAFIGDGIDRVAKIRTPGIRRSYTTRWWRNSSSWEPSRCAFPEDLRYLVMGASNRQRSPNSGKSLFFLNSKPFPPLVFPSLAPILTWKSWSKEGCGVQPGVV